MRNARLLFLIRLSFTKSTKHCDSSLLDASKRLFFVLVAPGFPPCGHLTHTFSIRMDLDFSLTDFPPASSEVVLTFLPFTPSPIFVFPSVSQLHEPQLSCLGVEKKFEEKKSQIFMVWHKVTGGQLEHTLSGKVACLCECQDRRARPTLLHLSISKSYQLSSTDSPL